MRTAASRGGLRWLAVVATVTTIGLSGAAQVMGRPDQAGTTAVSTAGAAPTLFAAGRDGGIREIASTDGHDVRTVADPTRTGGQVGDLAVAPDRGTIWFSRHDPLVGLPCDAELGSLSVASGEVREMGAGFAPAVSPDGSRLAYVATEPAGGRCSYAVMVVDTATGAHQAVPLSAEWAQSYGICALSWTGPSSLAVEVCVEADSVLHHVDLTRDTEIGDATFVGPDDHDRSWSTPAARDRAVRVAEYCCLAGGDVPRASSLRTVDATSGEDVAATVALGQAITSVVDLDAVGDDVFLVGMDDTGEQALYRVDGDRPTALTGDVVAVAG